jgi:hypothetical protein
LCDGSFRVETRRMSAARWPVDRLIEEVELLGARGLPREQY